MTAPLCRLEEIDADQPMLAATGAGARRHPLIILHGDGGPIGFRNACPHMGIMLDWEARRMVTRDGRFLRCTGHGALFRRADGVCVAGPCEGDALERVPLVVRDGLVFVDE